ncbi:hypothetical protein BJ165DRAFT_438389 [Panaeolus papilionaceus]|nr:hypothetical protein BJ165DRAFT_438389 [Panaeolus papilionaceus]
MHNGRDRDNTTNHRRDFANTSSPPQPFSSLGYGEPTTAQAIGTNRWYPKLTPFRSVTLIVGIALGVLKAVLTYQGSQFAPVAVEWICGTALFLLFYFLDALEKDIRLHDDSSIWFYDYDCLNLLWKPMRWFGIKIPEYSTSEAPIWNTYSSKPIVTNYRLLVSGTVLILGMLKAVLAYLGKSDGATAVDWIFGVIITAGLYILGLYECNTAKLLPSLFARNDSRLMLFVGYEGSEFNFLSLDL